MNWNYPKPAPSETIHLWTNGAFLPVSGGGSSTCCVW
jgi:hypothetical protein